MDARIVVEVAEMVITSHEVTVVTTIVIDDLDIELVSLFDPATILAPLRNKTSVAPNTILIREGVSAWAFA